MSSFPTPLSFSNFRVVHFTVCYYRGHISDRSDGCKKILRTNDVYFRALFVPLSKGLSSDHGQLVLKLVLPFEKKLMNECNLNKTTAVADSSSKNNMATDHKMPFETE